MWPRRAPDMAKPRRPRAGAGLQQRRLATRAARRAVVARCSPGGSSVLTQPEPDNEPMVTVELARRLRDAGLQWQPQRGDAFVIPDRDMDDEVFVLSDLTIDVHELPQGVVLGFNGTVEWALDSVEQRHALWLPSETQLRNELGDAPGRAPARGRRLAGRAGGRRELRRVDGRGGVRARSAGPAGARSPELMRGRVPGRRCRCPLPQCGVREGARGDQAPSRGRGGGSSARPIHAGGLRVVHAG